MSLRICVDDTSSIDRMNKKASAAHELEGKGSSQATATTKPRRTLGESELTVKLLRGQLAALTEEVRRN